MIGYVILAAAVLLLVVLIVYMLFIKSNFPSYKHKKEGFHGTYKARIWAENEGLLDKYNMYYVAKAAWAAAEAWKMKQMPKPEDADKLMSEVGCLITTKETFPKWGFYNHQQVASVQVWTKDKIYSRSIPMMVVHEGTIDRIIANREYVEMQPMIHEMLHALAGKILKDPDRKHENEKLWEVEKLAEELYQRW